MKTVLILDSDSAFRAAIQEALESGDYACTALTVEQARQLAGQQRFDLAVTALLPERKDRLELIGWFAAHFPKTALIAAVDCGSAGLALEALRRGADACCCRALAQGEQLRILIRRVLERRRLAHERDQLHSVAVKLLAGRIAGETGAPAQDAAHEMLSAFLSGARPESWDAILDSLPSIVRPGQEPAVKLPTWKEIEERAIRQTLAACNGNRTHAARALGISLRKLQYRIKEYGADRPRRRTGGGASAAT